MSAARVRLRRGAGMIARREFLIAGGTGICGFSLVDLLRAEAAAGIRSSQKAIINVHLDGGPSHLDTIDPKPQAPAEFRGDFRPIATALSGVQICELLPETARNADKFVFIR